MDFKEIGLRIRNLREKENISREKLAEIVDLSTNFVGQIERGEKRMGLETLIKISEFLGTSIDYIVSGSIPRYYSTEVEEINFLVENCTKRELAIIKNIIKIAIDTIKSNNNESVQDE